MRTLALLLVTGAAVIPLACGGDALSLETSIAEAASATERSGTSRMSFVMSWEIPEFGGEPVELSGEGVFDHEEQEMQATIDFSGLAGAAGVSGNADSLRGDLVFVDYVLFTRFPFLTQGLPNAKPWIRANLKGESVSDEFPRLDQNDPAQMLRWLRATSDVQIVDSASEVRGVPAVHYEASVRLREIPEEAPEEVREHVTQIVESYIAATGKTTMPIEVWVDEDGLVRRIRQEGEEPVMEGGEAVPYSITMDLYDFGVPVEIEVPPADQVMDEAEYDRMVEEAP